MSSKNKLPQYYIPSQSKTLPKQKQNSIKTIIINWLFQMDYEERIKTFSCFNYDICRTIIKIFEKHSSSSRLKFRINYKEKGTTISQNENSEDPYTSSENYKVNQKMFLKEIRFYKINQSNDAMTISHNLFADKDLFIFFFDELSNKKFLSELCPVSYDQKKGVYSCSSPKWIEEKGYYTISQLIIGYFENILTYKYNLSKKKKSDVNESLNNFFKKRSLVLDLIKNSSYKENLYDIIDLKKIISDVINDKQLINDEERRIASKRFMLGVYKPFKMFEPPVEYNVNSYYYKYKEMLMEKNEELLDSLLFYSFEGQSAIDRHIKEKIMEGFSLHAEKKSLENVLIEIQEDGFLSNNKKKGRRKKKKNKKAENEKNEETNEDNKFEINNINNNINIIFDQNTNNNYNNNILDNNKADMNQVNEIKIDKESSINIKINEDNNENNTSTISNSSHNNKDITQEMKNEIINEENEDKKETKEDSTIKDNNSINEEKDSPKQEEQKSEKESEENNIEESPKINKEIKEDNNIINNQPNQGQTQKKKKRKKNKKKNYKLTEEELNQIYSSFYNENNNFTNQNKNIKNKINPIPINNSSNPEKSVILHNLILSFEKKITKKISSLHEIKYNSIVLLCQKIKDHFKCGISIIIYGSYSTGLQLEESDIDISVEFLPNSNGKYTNNINLKSASELINELNEYLSTFPEFKNLFPIPNTQIPILKMKIIGENNIETKIDLTFNLKNTKNTIEFYNSTLKRYKQIKPLTLLIKNLIKKNNLASVFDGGFSSHSIFIMVTANVRLLLKNKSSLNLGDLLNGFLHFYGKTFNFTNTAIDLTVKNDPYIITQEFSNVPIFIDPVTKINVSKSSFQHKQLQILFSDTYDKLIHGEDNLNKTFEDIFF